MYHIYLIEDHRLKPYVGVTSKTPEKRFRQHKINARSGVDYHLYRAMRKYGPEKFEIILLDTAKTREEAFELEKRWIERLDTFEDWGYNMTPGGEGVIQSEETRRKISEAQSGENHPMYGKALSEETKKKISEAQSGEDSYWFGKTQSEEHRRKNSEANSGENHPLYGTIPSEETRRKISEANSGENNYWYGVTGEDHPRYRKALSEETKKKISETKSGENNPRASITAKQAAEIKWLLNRGRHTHNLLADVYETTRQVVDRISDGSTWTHVDPIEPEAIPEPDKEPTLDDWARAEIKWLALYVDELTYQDIGSLYGISGGYVGELKRGDKSPDLEPRPPQPE